MSRLDLTPLVADFVSGHITRRDFLARTSAMGLSGAAALAFASASAQNASPVASPAASPVGTREPVQSITRDEYYQELLSTYDIEDPATSGGSLIYGSSTDIQTVNPLISSDSYSGLISGLVFNSLVKTSALDGLPVPDLAEYWVQEADGVTNTFYLNQNATWHDGEPVTADDCVFSFDMTLDPDSLSVRTSSVAQVLQEYRKVDDYTFQLVAKQPFATFIGQTAGLVAIIPRQIWQDIPAADFASDPGATGQDPSRVVGSGPFRFQEWILGDHVTLVKNEEYWDQSQVPQVDEFFFQTIGESTSLQQSLITGGVDVTSVEFTDAALLEEDPNVNLTVYDTTSCNWFDMMHDPAQTELFTDVRVRQALMYALDRDLIAETIYQQFAVRADGTQPVLSIAYDPDRIETIYTYDPEQARSLLGEAGWTDSDGDGIVEKDGEAFSFECLYSEGAAIYDQQLPYMQQAWRDIGIDMQPTAIPFPTLSERGGAGDYQMRVRGFTWDVEGGQGTVFRCDSWAPVGFNSMRYCNPEFDELDTLQQAELDIDKRIDLLIQQSNILNDDVAAGFVVFRKSATGSRATVHNFLPNGYDTLWSLPWVWKDAEA